MKYITDNILKCILMIILLCLLTSCGTIEIASEKNYTHQLDGFVGKNIDDVVGAYGQADSVSQAPNGDRVFIYMSSGVTSTPVTCSTDSNGKQNCSGGGTSYNWCKTYFDVNNANQIVSYSLKGNDCKICISKNVLICM